VTVTDVLPAGLAATAISGTGWTCTLATLTCTRADALAAGASYPQISLTVNVATNAPASVTNSATVSGGGELNTANDTASDVAAVGQLADLTIAMTHAGTFSQGQSGAYAITVTNAGSAASSGTVSVTDVLPAGLAATAISGAGWTCTLATLTCTRADALAAGASYPQISLTVNVAANAPASVTNSATVSGGAQLNTTNDTANDATAIMQVPALAISKTHSGNFMQGQVGALYTIVVSNNGSVPTTGSLTVTDALPAGLTVTAISGAGWTCSIATLACTRADALASGATYPPISVRTDVAANAPSTLVNTATVAGGGSIAGAASVASDTTQVQPATAPGTVAAIPTLSTYVLALLALLLTCTGWTLRRGPGRLRR
jgi:uncharacterized repeat protein (TIGR01451 family)